MEIADLQIEDYSKQENKAGDRQINPLHVLERLLVVTNMVKDSVRANNRRNDRSNSIKKKVSKPHIESG